MSPLAPASGDICGTAGAGDAPSTANRESTVAQTVNDFLEKRRCVRGAEHPDTIPTLCYLASVYRRQGKNATAALYTSQALTVKRKASGINLGRRSDRAEQAVS